jgi:Mycothiol-dependent nitroreductase Rv2466c
MTGSGQVGIELYVDPCCPFAWIACQWLVEVRRHRAVDLALHLMSLPMLNEHQSISPGYRRLLGHTWGPARVAAAAVELHGPDALVPLYEAMARRIFAGADHYRVIRDDLESVIVDALSEVGLPQRLADAAVSCAYDGSLRASHNAAMAQMGNGVGTPIIHLGTAAFFGPVMTAVPRGSEALQVFDGLRLLAGYPRLFEIKRPLPRSLELTATEPDLSRPEFARGCARRVHAPSPRRV